MSAATEAGEIGQHWRLMGAKMEGLLEIHNFRTGAIE